MSDHQAEFETSLPPWTRELLAFLTVREREAFVLRETGLSLAQIGDRLGLSRGRAGQLVESARCRMTEGAARAVLLLHHVPITQPHSPCRARRCPMPEKMRSVVDVPIDSLPLTPSAKRRLRSGNVLYVGDLLPHTESALLRIHNLGRKSLREIRGALAALGLHLDMDVGGWMPPTPGSPVADPSPSDPGA